MKEHFVENWQTSISVVIFLDTFGEKADFDEMKKFIGVDYYWFLKALHIL